MIKPGNVRVYDSNLYMNESAWNGTLNHNNLMQDPLVTGRAIIIWDKLPTWFESEYNGFRAMTQKNFLGLSGIEDIQMETQTWNTGFNNNEFQVAGTAPKGNNEFTLTHKEFSGSPIKNMYQYWVSMIIDPETGISPYGRIHNIDYAAKNHTGSLMYLVMRPDVNNIEKKNIEFACYWTNVMPKKIPLSHLEYTQGTVDTVDIEIPFTGNFHIGSKVDNYARELLKESHSYITDGLYDPKELNQGFKNITDWDTNSGDTQQGLGDI